MPISNELEPSAFVSSPEIEIALARTPFIQLKPSTSPSIRFKVHKPPKIPGFRKSNTLTVFALPKEAKIAGWQLKSLVLVQVRCLPKEFLATTLLEGMAEYGAGPTESEAITDLVDSLGEYEEFLEKREESLGDDALNELRRLRQTIERTSES